MREDNTVYLNPSVYHMQEKTQKGELLGLMAYLRFSSTGWLKKIYIVSQYAQNMVS